MTATATQPRTTTWSIDPMHTGVEFSVRHLMIATVRGRFSDVVGKLVLDEARPERSSVEVVIDAASIDTRVQARDEHLRSADFFDVANHPKLTFRSRRIEGSWSAPGDTFRLIGDLTIRGVTREVPLVVTYRGRVRDQYGSERIVFAAEGKIDRQEFGLTWNAALETGGVVVANEVGIHLEIEAVRNDD
ncbi:MAG TPA: YceI family protein [Gemmatimonadales bacterium]|nr:YceI family protein [Gemmatimonadales bacterium]